MSDKVLTARAYCVVVNGTLQELNDGITNRTSIVGTIVNQPEADVVAGLSLLAKSRDGGPYCNHTDTSLGHGSACYDQSIWRTPND